MRLFGPAGEGRSSLIFSEAIFFSSNLFLDCSAYVLMPRLGYGRGGGLQISPQIALPLPLPPCFLYTFVFRSPPPHPESRFCHGKFFLILLCVFPLSQHAFKSPPPSIEMSEERNTVLACASVRPKNEGKKRRRGVERALQSCPMNQSVILACERERERETSSPFPKPATTTSEGLLLRCSLCCACTVRPRKRLSSSRRSIRKAWIGGCCRGIEEERSPPPPHIFLVQSDLERLWNADFRGSEDQSV